jgi:hypothetical protein
MMGALRSSSSSSSSKAESTFCQDDTSTVLHIAVSTVQTNQLACLHQHLLQIADGLPVVATSNGSTARCRLCCCSTAAAAPAAAALRG